MSAGRDIASYEAKKAHSIVVTSIPDYKYKANNIMYMKTVMFFPHTKPWRRDIAGKRNIK
ncbi:MAG: hypothetical protein ABJB05_12225 [Parafilimonas sp.]